MERLNWSSLVRSICGSRSGKAQFFKPVCVIAAIDLAAEGRFPTDDLDAELILHRFSDYVTPFFPDRGGDGFQPLWHLSNNQLWTFFKGGRPLTSKEFSGGKPGTRKRLIERFDRLAIHEGLTELWKSSDGRQSLRDQMLLMLQESDRDSRQLVPPLFNHQHLLDRDLWPDRAALEAYFAPLRQPSLFDGTRLDTERISEDRHASSGSDLTDAGRRGHRSTVPKAIDNVPSAVDYLWFGNRIVVGPNLASLPHFPSASSERDYAGRLEACAELAADLFNDLRTQRARWQVREDYALEIRRYLDRLPKQAGSGKILLAESSIRTIRDMFAAERMILPVPFAARLKALLQHHIAIRPFFPELDRFNQSVRSGRIEEPLPLDAVDSIMETIRQQTPAMFDKSVSEAIGEASFAEPQIDDAETDGASDADVISPPPDPIGEVDRFKAHDAQLAGIFNRLWKVFTSADELRSTTEAWVRTFRELSGPMSDVLDWLRTLIDH